MKGNLLEKILTPVLVLLVLAAAVGAVFKFTNIKNKINDFTNPEFYVEYGGTRYTGGENIVAVPYSGQTRFEVKNGGKYTVEVKPNVTKDTDFDYTVDGVSYPISDEVFTSEFLNDNVYKDYFVMECTDNNSIADILSRIWDGKEVVVNGSMDYPYLLVLTSSDGDVIKIAFSVGVVGVKISSESIVFGGE